MTKKIANFFKQISIFEYILTIISLIIIVVFSFAFKVGILKILFSLLGVIMLLFVSKGWIIGEFFSLAYMTLYAIISYFSHYYGEMIISIFISLPISIFTFINWIKHPKNKGEQEIRISSLSNFSMLCIITFSILLFIPLYFLLKYFNTPNLIISTLSIIASLIASLLLLFRSHYYALFFILNDIIVMILWILLCKIDISNLMMVITFLISLVFDIYGLINWSKIKKKQAKTL